MSQLARAIRRGAAGVLLAAAPLPVAAQQPVSPADSARARVLSQLPRGAWVRLRSGGAMLSGTIVESDAERATVSRCVNDAESGDYLLR
jgi:hypothetical protein